jgi:sugar phosphate isomerase/epimerase
VTIYAYRLTLRADMPDAEYDYTFNAAKALGATQITMELPADKAVSQRIGDSAVKHKVNVGYHLHTTATITAWDDAMAQSPRNGLQLDIGHYVKGTGISPVPLIEKHHARIFSMHLKDRNRAGHNQAENMPWGQGDTPIKDVLQVLKKNKWAIPVGVEFEYPIPPASTWHAEIAKCVQYGKEALGGVRNGAVSSSQSPVSSFQFPVSSFLGGLILVIGNWKLPGSSGYFFTSNSRLFSRTGSLE